MFRNIRSSALSPRVLNRRRVIILLSCLLLSLLLVPSLLASVAPASNRISNRDFELGPGHFYPWFKNGTAQIIGDESCCGQHETFFWPDGANHGWSSLHNSHDTWDGNIENSNQSGAQYGAVAQSIPSTLISVGPRYRLSAWVATSSGNTVSLEWYANGVTYSCASTTASWPGPHLIWPTSNRVACEFTPTSIINFNVHVGTNVSAGQWVVSDDWALTPLVSVPVRPGTILSRPVKYWARDYASTVDRAANSWNAATGRSLFVKATSEADAKLIIDGVDTFCDGKPGGDNSTEHIGSTYVDYPPGPCLVASGKQLVEVNIWYFSKWSGDPKQSTVAHELGHVLGLDESQLTADTCQLMRSGTDARYYYCGVVTPTTKDASSVP
jgi:hypothetical protein